MKKLPTMKVFKREESFSKPRDLRNQFWGGDKLLLSSEAMHQIGIKTKTFWRLCKLGKIKPIKMSERIWRFWQSDIENFINNDS